MNQSLPLGELLNLAQLIAIVVGIVWIGAGFRVSIATLRTELSYLRRDIVRLERRVFKSQDETEDEKEPE